MINLEPENRNEYLSTSLIVTGPFNSSPLDQASLLGAYSSSSFTVGEVFEAADSEPLGPPSRPLRADTVEALDSVLRSGVSESAILRDEGGEL